MSTGARMSPITTIEINTGNFRNALAHFIPAELQSAEEAFISVVKFYLGRCLRNRHFLITWQGDGRVPVGAIIGGQVIESIWRNKITAKHDGRNIGRYLRLIDCGGPTGQTHLILARLYPRYSR